MSSSTKINPFPEVVKRAFIKLGNDQRDRPESAMLDVQFMMGGGVLNPLVEHVGDLTHRMTHLVAYAKEGAVPTANQLGYDMVDDKVRKTHKWLNSTYGFEREFKDNMRNNHAYKVERGQLRVSYDQYVDKIYGLLSRYATEHAKLEVYNEAQWLARQAAINVGNLDWDGASFHLSQLKKMLKTEETYVAEAAKFTLTTSGQIVPNRYPHR